MKYIIYNTDSNVVYYKGYTYFNFDPSKNLEDFKHVRYDDYQSAKRALRKLRQEDMKFYKINCPVAKKENWKLAEVNFITEFNPSSI